MKILQIKLLVLITTIGLFSGCNSVSQSTNSNKPVNSTNSSNSNNSTNSNKPAEQPTLPPMVEPSKKTETNTSSNPNTSSNKPTANAPKGKLDNKINQAYFDKINDGMSLDEVGKIFGDEGMQISDMTINGKHSLMYMWATDDMKKKIRVTFEKDKVIEKEKDGF